MTSKLLVIFQKYLMRAFGLRPWLLLVQDAQLLELLAQRHYEERLLRRCLGEWLHEWRSAAVMKRVRAERFYEEKLKQKCLRKWVKVGIKTVNDEVRVSFVFKGVAPFHLET